MREVVRLVDRDVGLDHGLRLLVLWGLLDLLDLWVLPQDRAQQQRAEDHDQQTPDPGNVLAIVRPPGYVQLMRLPSPDQTVEMIPARSVAPSPPTSHGG